MRSCTYCQVYFKTQLYINAADFAEPAISIYWNPIIDIFFAKIRIKNPLQINSEIANLLNLNYKMLYCNLYLVCADHVRSNI